MKKNNLFLGIAVLSFTALLFSCSKDGYDDTAIWAKVNNLDARVTTIEQTLSRMNQDISSMNTIVNAIQQNKYITNIRETSDGYIVTFSDNNMITLVNGKDGKDGEDGKTPYIGDNGNWWIGTTDTGVKAEGKDGKDGENGKTPYIGNNGNWWIGTTDTGVKAEGKDGKDGENGESPRIGTNGNWWIGNTDLGVSAIAQNGIDGQDGKTPHIGNNGNWWIGDQDTGVPATGASGSGTISTDYPIISIELYEGKYYWVQILNGVKTFLLDGDGNKIPVDGGNRKDPIIKVSTTGYWVISYDGGKTWKDILDSNGKPVAVNDCDCKTFFYDVRVENNYLILVLYNGYTIYIALQADTEHSRDYEDTGIPYDDTPNPTISNPNIDIPGGVIFEYGYINNVPVTRVSLPGIALPDNNGWLAIRGTGETGQNLWISVDATAKGYGWEPAEDQTDNKMKADVIFTVDNSGSMDMEADAVANSIIKWANQLVAANIDLRVGCVGYSVSGTINGAIDMTTTNLLSNYLNRKTGTDRTVGFSGNNSSTLQSRISSYVVKDECGAMAIRYADANFSFRNGANRFYVNFTDEPNQPNYRSEFSVEFFKNQSNWNSKQGTIYTVYSGNQNEKWTNLYKEKPWLMSEYTGGQTQYYDGNATGMDLTNLKVTGAMENSFYLYFTDIRSLFDGKYHQVKITVRTPDGKYRGEKTFPVLFGSN